jgi:hypothetical protein
MNAQQIDPVYSQGLGRLIEKVQYARTPRGLADFIELSVVDDHGNHLRLAPMHQQWVSHVQYAWARGLKAMIVAPFGHGKSSTLAVPLVAHFLGMDPNRRVKIITNDDAGARKRVGAVKSILQSVTFQKLFPHCRKGSKWTDHELYLQRTGQAIDPSVHARGVLTTGIGGRADLEIFDDAVDQKNSFDPAQRRKVLAMIESTWLSRLEPDGKVLYIDTLWHLDDATHHLMNREGWCTLIQKVSPGCDYIQQELIGAIDGDYPVHTVPGFDPKTWEMEEALRGPGK